MIGTPDQTVWFVWIIQRGNNKARSQSPFCLFEFAHNPVYPDEVGWIDNLLRLCSPLPSYALIARQHERCAREIRTRSLSGGRRPRPQTDVRFKYGHTVST
jgi:hypothetical protein